MYTKLKDKTLFNLFTIHIIVKIHNLSSIEDDAHIDDFFFKNNKNKMSFLKNESLGIFFSGIFPTIQHLFYTHTCVSLAKSQNT